MTEFKTACLLKPPSRGKVPKVPLPRTQQNGRVGFEPRLH